MKRLLYIILILLFASFVQAATYYVKNGGSDAADGLSDGNAWATIGKLNTVSFSNNDIIQLKRGSTFTDATLTLNGTSASTSGITIQSYDSGNKPRIDGNSVRPIVIDHALVNLTIKDIDISGSDTSGNRCTLANINGLTIDGLDYNGHTGSSTYVKSNVINISGVDGDIEIKNCTIENVYKDTFANTYSGWGDGADAIGIMLWYGPADSDVKTSGDIAIYDNTISNCYSDNISMGGIHTSGTFKIYNNTFSGMGENAIDMKYSGGIEVYNNTFTHGGFGTNGSGYLGPAFINAGDKGVATWTDTYLPTNNNIHDNYFHTTKYVGVQTPGSSATIRDNYFKDVGLAVYSVNSDMILHANLFNLTTSLPDSESYLADPDEFVDRYVGTNKSAIRLTGSSDDNLLYGNTIYVTHTDFLYGIGFYPDGQTGVLIKNNIVQMTYNSASVYPLYVQDRASGSPTVSNNAYFGAHSNRVFWRGTVYDNTEESAFESAVGSADAVFSDPKFNDAGSSDFTLAAISPCIDSGAVLSENNGWNPTTLLPPNTVTNLDNASYGSGSEMGIYVFITNPPSGENLKGGASIGGGAVIK